jgi:hypothetical protein
MQPCVATIALLVSIRQHVLQQIRLWALLGGLRSCRCENDLFALTLAIYSASGIRSPSIRISESGQLYYLL